MAGSTEKPRKTTAPLKKAAAETAKKAAGKNQAAPEKQASQRAPTHQEIARLAEQYWAERGHAHGHAEQDWLRAEKELLRRA